MSGTDLDVLERGLIGMAKGLFSAEQGSKKLNKLLTQYGVSLDTIESLSPEEQFLALADVVARIQNPTTRAAMAMQLFGKSGQKLLPMLSGGRAGIAALQAEAAMLGRTMTTEDAQAAAGMDDAWNRFWPASATWSARPWCRRSCRPPIRAVHGPAAGVHGRVARQRNDLKHGDAVFSRPAAGQGKAW
jgi:hypothetical protein